MMKRLLALLLALACLFPMAHAEKVLYIQGTTSDRVHLRAEPYADAASLGLYYTGTAVVQLGDAQYGWIPVDVGVIEGFVHQDYLSDADYVPSLAPVYVVSNKSSTWVNLRSQPSMYSSVMEQLDNGTRVTVMGETADGWSYVRTASGDGYMKTSMLAPAEKQNQSTVSFATAEELPAKTTIVGQTREGDHIHHYVADNRQDIFFPAMEENPTITGEDVNFDGLDDLVIYTAKGSSNLYCRFYVFTDGMYVPAMHKGRIVELINYTLYPGRNMVLSRSNDGYAGALFVMDLYRWDETGTQLTPIRQAVSDDLTKTEYMPDTGRLTTTYLDALRVEIHDFTTDEYNGTLIYETETDHDQLDAAWFDTIDAAFWQGL